MNVDIKPLEYASQLRERGEMQAAEIIEALYNAVIDLACDNLRLRGTEFSEVKLQCTRH